jgi:hypothetical protein
VRSRWRARRADVRHLVLDPVVAAAPLMAGAYAAARLVARIRR